MNTWNAINSGKISKSHDPLCVVPDSEILPWPENCLANSTSIDILGYNFSRFSLNSLNLFQNV